METSSALFYFHSCAPLNSLYSRAMTTDLGMGDFRRVSEMPLWRALKNPSSASEWLAEFLGIESYHIHVTITKSEDLGNKIISTLGGRLRADEPFTDEALAPVRAVCATFITEPLNDSSVRFNCTVIHEIKTG